jgi:SAM-dependent methyltransferase
MTYDEAVRKHYDHIGAEHGLSPQSTMVDDITRQIETHAILTFVLSTAPNGRVADVGCGNGYTLARIAERFPHASLTGFEPNRSLRTLAESRFVGGEANVLDGDLRNPTFSGSQRFDLLICQRVIINILSLEDQRRALLNAINAVKSGGHLLFIEAFQSGLDRLNAARQEFELAPIPVANHNLNLPDDFFDNPALTPYRSPDWPVSPNELSTHYFVTRVLHEVLRIGHPLKRNSEFVKFFSNALPPAIGDYSQLRILAFSRAIEA